MQTGSIISQNYAILCDSAIIRHVVRHYANRINFHLPPPQIKVHFSVERRVHTGPPGPMRSVVVLLGGEVGGRVGVALDRGTDDVGNRLLFKSRKGGRGPAEPHPPRVGGPCSSTPPPPGSCPGVAPNPPPPPGSEPYWPLK